MAEAERKPRRRWGSGAVYQRTSDGLWIAAVRGDDGKRRVRYAKTKDEARAKLPELRREAAVGKKAPDRRLTVGRALLDWLSAREGVVRRSSYVRYEMIVRLQLAGVAHVRLADLKPENVREHVRRLETTGTSSSTIQQAVRILRSALTLAESDGLVERNAAKLVTVSRQDRQVGRALSPDEARQLLAAAAGDPQAGIDRDPLYALWALLLGTGLRMGEALGLRWSDIDLDAGTISVTGSLQHISAKVRARGELRLQRVEPKTAAGRRIVAPPAFALRPLRSLPMDAVYVFHRGHGRPLNPSTVQRAFAALVKRAKLPPMRLHDCRHTAATLLLANGASLDDVKRLLGHSSIAITSDVYGHLVEGRARELADVMDRAIG